MYVIRLIYSSVDIYPAVLLRHLFRYFGFYVDEVTESEIGELNSVVDYYIISNAFMKGKRESLEIEDKSKTVLVLKDGWGCDDKDLKNLVYSRDDELLFSKSAVELLGELLRKNDSIYAALFFSGIDWWEDTQCIVKAYFDNNILQTSLFTRCFYRESQLYNEAIEHYNKFILNLNEYMTTSGRESDLVQFACLYAAYEMDLVNEKNYMKYFYDPDNMLEECMELHRHYPDNEEIMLLIADVRYELMDDWLQACNDYAEPKIAHCAYANYKRGRILRSKLKEFDSAEVVLRKTIHQKKNYFQAWYQLGECYDQMAQYEESIDAFKEIGNILVGKYRKRKLAPIELEYLYKSVMRIAIIYKSRLGDYITADDYNCLAEEIRNKDAISTYVSRVGTNGLGNLSKEALIEIVKEAMSKRVDTKLEKIY